MTERNDQMRNVLEAALRYARRGWPVFPVHSIVDGVCTCGKSGCSSPGKHPANGNGVSGATKDESQIRQWFDGGRTLNLGIACGEQSGLFALDFDAPEGEQWFEAITGETLSSFATVKARTGDKSTSGFIWRGWHLLFKWTPELGRLKNAAKTIPGVDWRTSGGYVVVAPSLHHSGKHYEWAGDGEDADVATMPPSLLGAILNAVEADEPAPSPAASHWEVREGRRNSTLYRIGCGMRGRGEERDEILRELMHVNRTQCRPPLSDGEVEQTAASASKHPKGGDNPSSVDPTAATTDLWVARQFLRDWAGLVHWVPEMGSWIAWCEASGVWQIDRAGQVHQWFRETVSRIVRYFAQKVGGNNDLTRVLKRLASYHNAKPEQAALSMAATEPGVSVSVLELDARPDLLACGNCTVELQSGKVRPNDPADLLTRRTGVPFIPETKGVAFERFLAETFPDPEIGRYVQLALGSALIGRVRDHHLHIAIGSGGNGKSTLLGAVVRVMGAYATGSPPGLLQKPKGERHSTDFASLKGVRLAVTAESGESTVLDDEIVKRLTGNDAVTGRFLYKDNFTFEPSHHLWLMTNEEPRIGSVSRAMSRRLRLVPFVNEVPEGREDVGLEGRLRQEDAAILAWLLEGCRAYMAEGLSKPPEAVLVATRDYLAEQDVIKQFMEARYQTVADPGIRVLFNDLYADFTKYRLEEAKVAGRKAGQTPSRQSVAADLRRLQYCLDNGTGNKVYLFGLQRK